MDPFLGIGASAVAAAELGVPFVGFELDEGYFDQACERLRRASDTLNTSEDHT